MRNFGTYVRSPRARRTLGVGFDNPPVPVPGDAEGIPEVARRFPARGHTYITPENLLIDLDPYGERQEKRRNREIFEARD